MQKNFSLALLNLSNKSYASDKKTDSISKMRYIKDLIKNANSLKNQTAIIKLPTCIIEAPYKLDQFIENISILVDCGLKCIIVHDFKGLIEQKINEFNLKHTNDLTDFGNNKAIEIYEMILAGHVNKQIATKLSAFGVKSISLSGKDGQMIVTKNIRSLKSTNDISNFYVSEPIMIFPEVLLELESTMITPIISPIATTENGSTSIVEVDKLVAMIAISLEADHLVFMDQSFLFSADNLKINNKIELQKTFSEQAIDTNIMNASHYALKNSSSTLHFVNPNSEDALLKSFIF